MAVVYLYLDESCECQELCSRTGEGARNTFPNEVRRVCVRLMKGALREDILAQGLMPESPTEPGRHSFGDGGLRTFEKRHLIVF